MTFAGYLTDHWGLLVLLIGMAIVLRSDIHLGRRMIYRISLTGAMLFLYSVSCYIETYLGFQSHYTVLRPILSAVDYSLIGFIMVSIILILFPDEKRILYIPAAVNSVLSIVSIPTGLVFIITKENHFGRGPLGFLSYYTVGFYLLYLFICMFRKGRVLREEYPLLFFMMGVSVLCLVMPLYWDAITQHWFNITIALELLLYYVFLLQQFTKRDPLTKLRNRQSYYADAEKYTDSITAVITMDMDGLKEINDNEGHVAGDTALKALGDAFWNAAKSGERVYRIGGDEYAMLCIGTDEKKVLALIERIRAEVAKTKYTCSVGYAMRTADSTIDSLYQQADAMLYEEKQVFYERSGKTRRKR